MVTDTATDTQIGPIEMDWHEDYACDCRVYTTANELNWLRGLYRAGKFDLLLNLRVVYRGREWRGEGMKVDKRRVVDALEAICSNVERIMGVRGPDWKGVVVAGGILRREMLEVLERARRKGLVQ